jgi:hypothetical protein
VCVDWTDLAQERDQWVDDVDTVKQLWVSIRAENFLTNGRVSLLSNCSALVVSYNFATS